MEVELVCRGLVFRLPMVHCDSFFLYFSEQKKLVERLAGEISKYKKELKVMKNEKRKRKENENKITQVDEASFGEGRRINEQVNFV